MLDVLSIFQQQMMMRTIMDSGNLLPDLQIYCQIFVKKKNFIKFARKLTHASDWGNIFKTPVFVRTFNQVILIKLFHRKLSICLNYSHVIIIH
jgi:hypothetical protein